MELEKLLANISPWFLVFAALGVAAAIVFGYFQANLTALTVTKADLEKQLLTIKTELEALKNQDQYKRNESLEQEIKNITKTYQDSLTSYEEILKLQESKVKTDKLNQDFVQILKFLADRNYASASAVLANLNAKIESEKEKLAASFKIPENIPMEKTPPASGYRRQTVQTEVGSFLVDIVSADLNNTRVIVDTASDSDCLDNCPVLSLGEYVARNGAFAGINGTYFCPATYPSCAGKSNSFNFLLMNKNKKYLNSDNNVYSVNPAVIFYGNTARFVTQALEWGRDTMVDAVLSNYPLLVFNGQIYFTGSDDPKQNSRGNRSFVGTTGSTVYIGVVHNATVAHSARVLATMGIANAINLDDGGSTALWYGGHKVGPGRNLPNALLFIPK